MNNDVPNNEINNLDNSQMPVGGPVPNPEQPAAPDMANNLDNSQMSVGGPVPIPEQPVVSDMVNNLDNSQMPLGEPVPNPEFGQPVVNNQITNDEPQKLVPNKKFIIIGAVVAVIVIGVVIFLLFGGKKLVCTSSTQQNGINMAYTTTLKEKGKDVHMTLRIDLTKSGGFTDQEIKELEDSYKKDQSEYNVKVKTSKNKISITGEAVEEDTDLKGAEEELASVGFTCK